MQLALPISSLIVNNDALSMFPDIDVYQYRGRFSFDYMKKKSRYGKTLLFHGSKGILCSDFVDSYKDLANDFLFEDFSLCSCNCAPACEEYEVMHSESGYDYYNPISPILDEETLQDIISRKASKMSINSDYFALENSNRYNLTAYTHVIDPEFLCKAVKRNGIYFCLDIAHATVSFNNYYKKQEKYFGKSLMDFIFSYPLDRCIEIHVSSPGLFQDGGMYDGHSFPTSIELNILKNVLDRIDDGRLIYVAVEYYKDLNTLRGTYDRIKEMMG